MSRTVCIDFDGVLAQYDGWKGEEVLGDPAPGALEFVKRLLAEGYTVAIHTTRPPAKIWKWLEANGLLIVDPLKLYPTNTKPPALVYIDDRAFRFTGDWQAAYEAIVQPTWWERPKTGIGIALERDERVARTNWGFVISETIRARGGDPNDLVQWLATVQEFLDKEESR